MTVSQLIQRLQLCDPDREVIFIGNDDKAKEFEPDIIAKITSLYQGSADEGYNVMLVNYRKKTT